MSCELDYIHFELADAIEDFRKHMAIIYNDSMLPLSTEYLKKYARINSKGAAECFIALTDSETKTLGKLNCGDVLKPASFYGPTKGVRANVFKRETWAGVFGEYGMNHLPKGRR